MWPPFELAAAAAVAIARGRASCVQFVRMSRGFSSGWGNAGDRAGERPRVRRRVGGFRTVFRSVLKLDVGNSKMVRSRSSELCQRKHRIKYFT